jgi:hypothetical protein
MHSIAKFNITVIMNIAVKYAMNLTSQSTLLSHQCRLE